MKKIIFGTVVAALAMLSACENLAPVEPSVNVSGVGSVLPSEPVVLTATIGADTKTFLEWDGNVFKTRWAEEDSFILWNADVDLSQINPNEDYERYASWYVISEGVGESTATFVLEEGVMPERFLAFYGEFWPETEDGNWYYWLSRNQGREVYETKHGELIQGFDSYDYPMYATGEGQEVHFRNMLSLFKINVTGRGEILKNITITALDENVYIAGDAKVDFSAPRATFEFSPGMLGNYEKEVFNSISFNPNLRQDYQEIETVLSSDPVECYIIIPPRNYPSGFKVTLTTDEGVMEFETESDLSFEPSELRELNVSYESTLTYEGNWRLLFSDDTSEILEKEGEYYVLKDCHLSNNDYFTFAYGTSQLYRMEDASGQSYGSAIVNACANLRLCPENEEQYTYVNVDTRYDIYLDAENLQVFIMCSEITPEDLPTRSVVAYKSYWAINEYAADNSLVMVSGCVVAKTTRGVVIDMGYSETIFLYGTIEFEVGDYVDIYARKTTYRGLPELTNNDWYCWYPDKVDIPNYTPDNITHSFENLSYDFYAYVAFLGKVVVNGGNYYIYVNDNVSYVGKIFYPTADLSEFDGKTVYVKGYFLGNSTSGSTTYLNLALTDIMLPNIGGSTEDVIPDDDIVLPTR